MSTNSMPTTPVPPAIPQRKRGRPPNLVLTPPTDSTSARALLSLLLTQTNVRVRVLASAERLMASFMQAEAIEREAVVTSLRDAVATAKAEVEVMRSEVETVRSVNADVSHRFELMSRHAGIVEDENTRLKKRITELEKQVTDLKQAQPQPSVRARPPESFDPVAHEAEMRRLDSEIEQRKRDLF